jgi:hypothetical protein
MRASIAPRAEEVGSRYSSRPGAVTEEVFVVRPSAGPPPPATGRRSLPPPAPQKAAPTGLNIPRMKGAVPPTLDHRGAFILRFVDGMMSIEDIVDVSGLPRDDVFAILRDLLASGTIELT